MKIASIIADLLYIHECVVIPGLGGFITQTHPAKVHLVKDQFKPPYKEIVFNPHLRANDGMLLNYIAQQDTLSYADAKLRLDRFVLKCLNELDKGNKISFRKIGRIYYNEEKQFVFQADETQNYLADSFGLSDFISPSIKREGFQEKIEKTFQQKRQEKELQPIDSKDKKTTTKQQQQTNRIQQPERKIAKRKNKNRQFWGVTLLILAILLITGFTTKDAIKDYYTSYAGWFPLFYASPNEYVAHHLDKIPLEKLIKDAPSIKDISFVIDEDKTPETTVSEEETTQHTEESSNKFSELQPAENTVSFETAITDETPLQKDEPVIVVENTPVVTKETNKQLVAETKKTSSNYYIIAGVFSNEENAQRLVKTLKSKGFASEIINKTKTGKWRVAYEGHASQQEADHRLATIRKEEDKNAWLLKF
ncbi:MAG: SPOR domain-containing protein [Lentimicrobiaceae bacterium]|jgi:cell division septation protein DedD|nr:SPOR domain-containing protein [Lentimicrobiaceae bacterium]